MQPRRGGSKQNGNLGRRKTGTELPGRNNGGPGGSSAQHASGGGTDSGRTRRQQSGRGTRGKPRPSGKEVAQTRTRLRSDGREGEEGRRRAAGVVPKARGSFGGTQPPAEPAPTKEGLSAQRVSKERNTSVDFEMASRGGSTPDFGATPNYT